MRDDWRRCSMLDLEHEKEFAARFEERFNVRLNKLTDNQRLDDLVTRGGRACGFLEYKWRSHARGTFPAVWVNVTKWTAMAELASATGSPVWFAVTFGPAGGDWIYSFSPDDRWPVEYCESSGEAVVSIPVESFRPMNGR